MAISYTRTFSHTDWIDNVDRVQAGGDSGFNVQFHDIEAEFDNISGVVGLIAAALQSIGATEPDIGIAMALQIANGAQIPVPAGFAASECIFFAYPKVWSGAANSTSGYGFTVYADNTGLVHATAVGSGQVLATGLAVAKKGGW